VDISKQCDSSPRCELCETCRPSGNRRFLLRRHLRTPAFAHRQKRVATAREARRSRTQIIPFGVAWRSHSASWLRGISADISPLWDARGRPGRLELVAAAPGLDGTDYSSATPGIRRDAYAANVAP
jgi:hypothetical protein